MDSFVHKTAKSVLAFSVLRTALPPYTEYMHVSMGSGDTCCKVLENFSIQKEGKKSWLLPAMVK